MFSKKSAFLFIFSLLISATAVFANTSFADPNAGTLTLTHGVGDQEPLLGGTVSFDITLGNTGSDPVTDKGYNVTISSTLPVSVTYVSATISPTYIEEQADGSTLLFWDNIADLEVNEELGLSITGSLSPDITIADTITNTVLASFNNAPDNSLAWQEVTSQVLALPQAIDIETVAIQSTADEQATGAGEYDGSADWPYQYKATIKNNNVGSTEDVVATVILPAGVAYLGDVSISPNPNNSSTTPDISLNEDGSLTLEWDLGTLTTAQYATPVEILFDVAIPHNFRTSDDFLALAGPFAGPMSGGIIPEDQVMEVTYEATGMYDSASTADGTTSTPDDDAPVIVIAEYLTISKSASPTVVGIGDTVTFNIDYFVSEYYTTTSVVITDILPDGMTFVSSSLFPSSITEDSPGAGQTTIVFDIPTPNTIPGSSGTIEITATVDETYERAPYAGQPIVSADSLTNQSTLGNDWEDIVVEDRSDAGIPDQSNATVTTRKPTLTKDVKDPVTGLWGDESYGFTGDTIYFRINFAQAADVDGKEVVIRDFLPRGMTFVGSTDTYTSSGTFTSAGSCTTNVSSPTIGDLNGLQYLEWRLCDVDQGSTWETQFGAILGDMPDVQPNWIVGNFGKLSFQNTYGDGFSERDFATVDYRAPDLVLTKSSTPSSSLNGGDAVAYTITVENQGDATAYNLNLLDILPEWLIVSASGGSATPASSSFTADTGAQAGNGGTATWSQIASLAVGESQTFTYNATVKNGVIPGEALTNIASVAYNSRSDNTGHAWTHSSDPEDNHTADNTVYVEGLTITKSFEPNNVTIGDIVTWTLDVNVPANVHAHFPVVEENNLPQGFDYVANSTVINNATLSTAHAQNPLDDGYRDLRWFVDSIDNSSSGTVRQFSIEFQTLFTGVQGTNTANEFHIDNCKNYNKTNTAYVGWYGTSNGFSGGQAEDSISTSYDYKSPKGTAKIKLQQPCLNIAKSAQYSSVGSDGQFYYEIVISNSGDKPAFDVEISDTLPAGITYNSTNPVTFDPAPTDTGTTLTNSVGDTEIEFTINEIPADGTATIRYFVNTDPKLSASLDLVNTATITEYSTQPGTPADTNSDGLNDERVYSGPTATAAIRTYNISIKKESDAPEEFTYGSTIVYTLTVPMNPIKAYMYDVVISDPLPEGLEPVSTSAGSFDGNTLTATFAEIGELQQEVIVIEARVPADSSLQDGAIVSNAASVTTDQDSAASNTTTDNFSAPALVVDKVSDLFVVSEGDTVEYTITLKNVGTGTAYNIDLSDILPANQSYLNSEDGSWTIAELAGNSEQTFTFSTNVDYIVQGVGYTNSAYAVGEDAEGGAILSDSSSRVPADDDPLDLGQATIYGGPLECNSEIKNVAFEDLKNTGWSDWDYNDLIVKIETELCFTPSSRTPVELTQVNACENVSIEAENGILSGFTVINDAAASGGSYIHMPDTEGEFDPADPDAATSATFTFNVSVPGSYKFTGIAEGTSFFADSFWFAIDDEAPIQWAVPRDQGLTEVDVADYVNDIDPYSVDLAPGDHTVTIYNREDGARLDKLTMVCQGVSETYVPNTLATVNITYTAGARGAHFNHTLKHDLDVSGSGQSHWQLFDSSNNVLQNERGNFGSEADFVIIPDTHEALPPYHADDNERQTNTRKDQPEYTKGYWATLSVSLNDASINPLDGLQQLPWDVYLPVEDTGEEVHLLVPGHLDNLQVVSASYDGNIGSPLLGQSLPLGFSFEESWHWPTEFSGVWKAYPDFVDFIESGRSESLQWYELEKSIDWFIWETHLGSDVPFDVLAEQVTSRYQGSPIVADLDLDGNNEIIVGDLIGNEVAVFTGGQSVVWKAATNGGIRGSAAAGNLDDDNELEVIALAEDGMLYGWNHDGSVLDGYPIQIIDGRLLSSPIIVDLEDDASNDILISASNGRLYARNADGSAKWNSSIGDIVDAFGSQSLNSSPAYGDLDGDGDLEVVVGSYDKCMYAFDHLGTELWKFCTDDIIVSTPIIAEFALDSSGDEVIFGSGDQYIYVIKKDGSIYWKRETGWIVQGSPIVEDINGDGFADVLIGSDDDKLHAKDFDGRDIPGWPRATSGDIVGKASIGDIDGDGEDEILVGSSDANIYAFEKDGSAVSGDWPQATDASIKGATVIANMDDDPALEVVATDFTGNLYVIGADRDLIKIFLPVITR